MPTSLADYTVIKGGSITLRTDQQETYDFNMYEDMIQRVDRSGHGSKRPVLVFFADPADAENLLCKIEINNREVFSYRYTGGTGRTHSVVIDNPYDLRFDNSNTIQFVCLSGEGSISFSDIVLLYQRWI